MTAPVSIRMDPRRARRLCYRMALILRRTGSFDAARSAIHSARLMTRGELIRIIQGGA